MSYPTMAVRNAMSCPAARPCCDSEGHWFLKRPWWALPQLWTKSISLEKSRFGDFFFEPVKRIHRAEREVGCVGEASGLIPTFGTRGFVLL